MTAVPSPVISRRSAESGLRTASTLEAAYFEAAGELAEMIRRGEFPLPGSRSDLADSLRVGDGFVRTNAAGTVRYASPNAMSAYRRLGLVGDLVGPSSGTSRRVSSTAGRPTGALRSILGVRPAPRPRSRLRRLVLLRVIPLRAGGHRSRRADPAARRHRAAAP